MGVDLNSLRNESLMKFMLNVLSNDPLFTATEPYVTLSSSPLGFIDVGARGGVQRVVEPLANLTGVLAFEPDKEECARIQATTTTNSPWAVFEVEPLILAGQDGEVLFQIFSNPVNSSLLMPNVPLVERYKITGYEPERSVILQASSLDTILFEQRVAEDYWGEFLKLDVQGAELDILNGALRTLNQRTVCALIEVEFCQLYKDQKLFSEVELFMRQQGFSFYGFTAISYRSARLRHLLHKSGMKWRERILHADAVFFKDPLGQTVTSPGKRANHSLFVCAMLLGYYDFALELALETWATGDEAKRIMELVHQWATYGYYE